MRIDDIIVGGYALARLRPGERERVKVKGVVDTYGFVSVRDSFGNNQLIKAEQVIKIIP